MPISGLVSPVAERDDVSEGLALSVPACGVPLRAVPQGVRDVVQVGIDQTGSEDTAIWLESLPDDFTSELVQARERGQVRAGESSDRHVVPIGPPRYEQMSSSLPSRLASWTSAPEFDELGKGSALVVTGSSGGRTQRWIHRIDAEHVLGVAIREDRFDSAAACA